MAGFVLDHVARRGRAAGEVAHDLGIAVEFDQVVEIGLSQAAQYQPLGLQQDLHRFLSRDDHTTQGTIPAPRTLSPPRSPPTCSSFRWGPIGRLITSRWIASERGKAACGPREVAVGVLQVRRDRVVDHRADARPAPRCALERVAVVAAHDEDMPDRRRPRARRRAGPTPRIVAARPGSARRSARRRSFHVVEMANLTRSSAGLDLVQAAVVARTSLTYFTREP